jgi:cytoskeletal protein CcmA (bactofilin family)
VRSGSSRVAAGAVVEGDIEASRLVVDEGATLNGRVSMTMPEVCTLFAAGNRRTAELRRAGRAPAGREDPG